MGGTKSDIDQDLSKPGERIISSSPGTRIGQGQGLSDPKIGTKKSINLKNTSLDLHKVNKNKRLPFGHKPKKEK